VGLVCDENGKPVERARVYFTRAPGPVPDVAALTASDGSFSFAAPVEGAYTVESRAEGLPPASVTVSVRGGEEARVKISLKAR
jgi:Carboxypeptidase regulatory-like domain